MSTLQVLSTITLNLLRPNSNVVVYAKQYDGFSRLINASLVAEESVWEVPTGVSAMIRYAKPDGTVGFYDMLEDGATPAVTNLGSGLIQIALAQQALTAAGNVMVDVNFFAQDESRLTTLSFVVSVEKGSPADDAMMSSDYFNILDRKISAVIAATTHPPKIDPTTQNWLLWDEDEGVYADSGYSSVGQQGPAGVITVRSEVRYQEGDSPTTIPTGSWANTPPAVRQGYYLWQRETLTFGDGTTSTSYLVARQGRDGSGSVVSVNNVAPDNNGNVQLSLGDIGAVGSVNDIAPDVNGNVQLSPSDIGAVGSVNNITPDANGNVTLDAGDVGALPGDTAYVSSVNGRTGDVEIDISIDKVYPVGSVYMSMSSTNPASLFGGTWEQIEDAFLLAAGSSNPNAPQWEFVGNYYSQINGASGWTAPDDGVCTLRVEWGTNGSPSYWYVDDTTSNRQVGRMGVYHSNGFTQSLTFPVQKGHVYKSTGSSNMGGYTAYFYKLVDNIPAHSDIYVWKRTA